MSQRSSCSECLLCDLLLERQKTRLGPCSSVLRSRLCVWTARSDWEHRHGVNERQARWQTMWHSKWYRSPIYHPKWNQREFISLLKLEAISTVSDTTSEYDTCIPPPNKKAATPDCNFSTVYLVASLTSGGWDKMLFMVDGDVSLSLASTNLHLAPVTHVLQLFII